MTRRAVAILATLTLGIFSGPATSAAQPKKIPRVGVLAGPPPAVGQRYVEAGREALRELGYVEGQNIAIDYRWGEAKGEVVRAQAAELVNLKPDIIVTVAEGPTRAVKALTSTIPIVMVAVDDPVGLGFVESLARPGGNVTGTASFLPELSAKRLQLLKEVVPKASRAAFLWNGNPGGVLGFKETEAAARKLGLTLQSFEAKAAADVPPAFSAMKTHRADALIVLTDPATFSQRAMVADLAAQHRLPAVYELREFVDAGGLMSYGTSLIGMVRRTAVFVDKILKGAKPGNLPVEQPATFELVINLKAAKALGLTIPQSVLIRADQVIQ